MASNVDPELWVRGMIDATKKYHPRVLSEAIYQLMRDEPRKYSPSASEIIVKSDKILARLARYGSAHLDRFANAPGYNPHGNPGLPTAGVSADPVYTEQQERAIMRQVDRIAPSLDIKKLRQISSGDK